MTFTTKSKSKLGGKNLASMKRELLVFWPMKGRHFEICKMPPSARMPQTRWGSSACFGHHELSHPLATTSHRFVVRGSWFAVRGSPNHLPRGYHILIFAIPQWSQKNLCTSRVEFSIPGLVNQRQELSIYAAVRELRSWNVILWPAESIYSALDHAAFCSRQNTHFDPAIECGKLNKMDSNWEDANWTATQS